MTEKDSLVARLNPKALGRAAYAFDASNPDLGTYVRLQLAIEAALHPAPEAASTLVDRIPDAVWNSDNSTANCNVIDKDEAASPEAEKVVELRKPVAIWAEEDADLYRSYPTSVQDAWDAYAREEAIIFDRDHGTIDRHVNVMYHWTPRLTFRRWLERERIPTPSDTASPADEPPLIGLGDPENRETRKHQHLEDFREDAAGDGSKSFSTATVQLLIAKIDYQSEQIASLTKERERWQAWHDQQRDRADGFAEECNKLRSRLSDLEQEAVKVVEPFAKQADTHGKQVPDSMFIDDYERDKNKPWYSLAGLRVGELRAARAFLDKLKGSAS